MSLAKLIKAVQNDLPITLRHEKWLSSNSNAKYSEKALSFAKEALSGAYQFRKRMIFRSSGVGTCQRRRIFAAVGMKERSTQDGQLSNIFHTGNMLHLKWQMAGLTEGWLTEAEVIRDRMDLRFGGTIDGVLWDGSGFEFKTINSFGFAKVREAPKDLHLRQVHGYMLLEPKFEKFSIVYENKDSGEWREYRVERDELLYKSVEDEIARLNISYNTNKLPAVLPECRDATGSTYRNCPFRDRCLSIKKWPTSAS